MHHAKLRWNMNKESVLIAILVIMVVIILVAEAFSTFKQVDKQRCLNMPFSDMIKDSSCDEYWRD